LAFFLSWVSLWPDLVDGFSGLDGDFCVSINFLDSRLAE
jgi:hypothetical protein